MGSSAHQHWALAHAHSDPYKEQIAQATLWVGMMVSWRLLLVLTRTPRETPCVKCCHWEDSSLRGCIPLEGTGVARRVGNIRCALMQVCGPDNPLAAPSQPSNWITMTKQGAPFKTWQAGSKPMGTGMGEAKGQKENTRGMSMEESEGSVRSLWRY